MRKTFAGVRLRTLREQRGLTQAALAQALDLSTSYVNQLENNQRPLSVPVLLRLQSALGADLQFFSEDGEARLVAQLQDVVSDTAPAGAIPNAEVQALAQQMPALAQWVIRLHRQSRDARDRLQAVSSVLGERDLAPAAMHPQPHEEVRDFFHAHNNHMAELDALAESLHHALLAPPSAAASTATTTTRGKRAAPHAAPAGEPSGTIQELERRLAQRLAQAHGIRAVDLPAPSGDELRRFDARERVLWLSPRMDAGRRAFQIATQIAYLEAGELMTRMTQGAEFSGDEARSLARIGLASYFAGALVLPYAAFLQAAEALRYDIDLLAQCFGVSFETVCHRLSTLQRADARGVPFFFVRVDRAGNISKRQSATDFHFSRTGGTCPLWNVYEAFAQPHKVLTQVAAMPDGRTYLWIARCITRASGGYRSPVRSFAIGLGCDLRHASRLVYAKGLDLSDPESATPIGPGCKVCERRSCEQRAFPALGRRLRVDENERLVEPYASA